MRRAAARILVAAIAAAMVVPVVAPPGIAAVQAEGDEPAEARAIIVGRALSSGAFVPFRVNPNFDFWPAYSFSEITNSRARGLSGGLWPGFLVDAFAFLFGYQPQARAAMGVAESSWPDLPHEAKAGTSDFGTMCTAGRDAEFALPRAVFGSDANPRPTAKFPEPMMTGCVEMWANYGGSAPWKVSMAQTQSDRLRTTGASDVFAFEFGVSPKVRVGAMRSSTTSDAISGADEVSVATTVLEEIEVLQQSPTAGEPDVVLLRIGTLRTSARVTSDGTKAGTTATWELGVTDVTSGGDRVIVDRASVSGSVQGTPVSQEIPDATAALKPLRDRLIEHGVDLQVVAGSVKTEPVLDRDGTPAGMRARADAGGLVVRFMRPAMPPAANPAAEQTCKQIAELDDATFSDGPEEEGAVPRATVTTPPQPNPAFEPRAPYDQLPPTLDVNQQAPPPAACPFVLLNRATDVGVVLGTAQAETQFQHLPPLPPLPPFVPPVPDREIVETIPGSGGDGGFGLEPRPGPVDKPPPAARFLGFSEGLGADVAARVKVVYGGLALAVGGLLVGRGAFRSLMRL